MEYLKYLKHNPWPDVNWNSSNKPIIIVDGVLYSLEDVTSDRIRGDFVYVVGANEKNIQEKNNQNYPWIKAFLIFHFTSYYHSI